MAKSATHQGASLTWKNPELGNVLAASTKHGRVVWLQSLNPTVILSDLPALRERVAELGLQVLCLNPNSGEVEERTLEGVLRRYLQKAERRGSLDSETLRLAEWLQRAPDATDEGMLGRLRQDTVGRIWTRLSHSTPAILVAIDLEDARPSDLETLRHLARFVFSDPIENLTPETESAEQALGALVVVGEDAKTLGESALEHAICLDYAELSESAIREFLEDEDVVRRFLETSGGDIRKLRDLVSHLPETAEHLQLHRYRRLESHERTLLAVLAVAGEPLAADRVQHAVALLEASEYFARTLKNLTDEGFLRRSIGAGEIQVRISDLEFAHALRESLEEDRKRSIHLALANAERVTHEDNPSVTFLAQHFVAAGELAEGLAYGARAIRKQVAEQAFDEAILLAESVLKLGGDAGIPSEEWSELHLLAAHAATGAGQHRRALSHLQEALTCAACGHETEITVQIGHTLNRLSQFDAALKHFDEALSEDIDAHSRRDVRLGRAEALYALGKHDVLVEDLEDLVARLIEDGNPGVESDRALVKARNVLGKVGIFRARYGEASALFAANRKLAGRWGWDDEVARAQANLGVVALQERNFSDALVRLNEALTSTGLRGSHPRAYCLVNLATVYQRQRNYGKALESCLEALRNARTAGDDVAYSVAAHNLATIYQDLGAFARGRAIIDHLHARYEPEHRTLTSRWNRLVHGYLHLDEGDYERSIAIFEELVDEEDIKSVIYGPEASLRLAQAHFALGQVAHARSVVDRFEIGAENGDRGLLEALLMLQDAEFDSVDERWEDVYRKAQSARSALHKLGAQNDPARATLLIADALEHLGRGAELLHILEEALGEIVAFANTVPQAFRATFYAKPYHRQIIERLQRLDANVPVDVERAIATPDETSTEPANASSLQLAEWRERYGEIIGDDPSLHHIFRVIDRVAKSDATVLIYGESGTGKELISGALHAQSNRRNKPFIKVNCAAFVENLLLSELFGHEKGAFTGAVTQKVGRFEAADGGTIFLDEIGDISPNTQVALLRVLQEGTFERVGGSDTLQVNVRVVCATNKNLEELVKRGEFRLDLYYRLKGVVIENPPLRERRQDIPKLVAHFAERYAQGAPKRFSRDVLRFLASYSWPGNVRELQNFVKSILLFVEGDTVRMSQVEDFREFFVSGEFDTSLPELDFDAHVHHVAHDSGETTGSSAGASARVDADPEQELVEKIVFEGLSLNDLKKRLEIESIKRALLEAQGNVTQAADILQMKRPRLSQIINAHDELSSLKSELVG